MMTVHDPRRVASRDLRRRLGAIAAAAAVFCLCKPASARTLEVGPDQNLKSPSAAAAIAAPGDIIEIAPGEYFDCAVWTVDNLTIEGKGDGAVITDKTCQGKALFITKGNDITIRNLTFTRARVPDQNGAGIRVEGKNLTIEHSRFIDNEEGILTGDSPQSHIVIKSSEFIRNGKCESGCAHGVYVGRVALLHIENSKFLETRDGHHIKSRALKTELIGNEIMDGLKGTASFEVELPNGGSLIMENNTLEKGPNNGNHTAAVSIGAEGVTQHTDELLFKGNKFTNDDPHEAFFVKNLTATEAVLTGNSFKGKVKPLSGDGSVH